MRVKCSCRYILPCFQRRAVLDKLLAHRQGKTTILISHRPSVIARADYIVFLEEGKLQMQGSIEDIQIQTGIHQKFLLA
jgi:ATP-binding cassette, subfamily C, bacterial